MLLLNLQTPLARVPSAVFLPLPLRQRRVAQPQAEKDAKWFAITPRARIRDATDTYNVRMIKFEWDEPKAIANLKKHHVSFEEAKSIFFDEFGVQFFDEDHSSDEERFLMPV